MSGRLLDSAPVPLAAEEAADRPAESFQGLLLRHRGRTGLTQRQLAARVGVSRGSVQDWEAGLSYPDAQHLQALIAAILEAGGLTHRRSTGYQRVVQRVSQRR